MSDAEEVDKGSLERRQLVSLWHELQDPSAVTVAVGAGRARRRRRGGIVRGRVPDVPARETGRVVQQRETLTIKTARAKGHLREFLFSGGLIGCRRRRRRRLVHGSQRDVFHPRERVRRRREDFSGSIEQRRHAHQPVFEGLLAVVVRVAVWNQAQTQRRVDLFVSPGGMEEVVVGQLQRVRRRVVSSGCSRSSAWWGASISIICSKASLWKPHEPAFSAKPSSSSTLTASMLAPAPSSSRSSVESQRARFCPRGDDTTSSMGLVDAASRSMAVARVRVQLCRGGFGIAGWIRLIGGDAGGKATRCGGRGVLWPVSSSWTCVGLGRVH
jgi:hypothetical protein